MPMCDLIRRRFCIQLPSPPWLLKLIQSFGQYQEKNISRQIITELSQVQMLTIN